MSKFAVITGSSGGIGSALVDAFLSDNYSVVGIDATDSGRNSVGFLEINADLFEFTKNENYREQILNQIKNYLPERLDDFVLINNAALQILNPVSKLNLSDWDKTLTVNTIAPFFLIQGFLEQLTKTHGHVINISSIHSKLTKANFSCYATSKAALEALTRSLAIELSVKGVSVNAIAPAAIATQMLKDGFAESPEKLKELESYHPSGSIGTPAELAVFVKSITDQRGGFLTGSVLEFNGGIAGRLHDPI
jgi:NAD(P)-dependent dehydrogenase (short-subunit alcohol dehydrogenase family)